MIGGIVGGVVGGLALLLVGIFLWKRKSPKKPADQMTIASSVMTQGTWTSEGPYG
jgi:anaerobic C4-dicarboxylate transporter